MKKSFLLLVLFCFCLMNITQAQNVFPSSGNVGIGTTSPASNLQIDPNGKGGSIQIGNSSSGSGGFTNLSLGISSYTAGYGYMQSISSSGSSYGDLYLDPVGGNLIVGNVTSTTGLSGNGNLMAQGNLYCGKTGNSGTIYLARAVDGNYASWLGFASSSNSNDLILANYGGSSTIQLQNNVGGAVATRLMLASSTGNILIHTTVDDRTNALQVNGFIKTQKITVTQTGWSDFVFDSAYHLPTLSKTETYIKINHHLPDIPSAKEIKNNGLDLGSMEKKQMQKIEELTLYQINADKRINELEDRDAKFQQEISVLKEEIKQLKNK